MAEERHQRDGAPRARKPYAAPRVIYSELRIKESAATTKLPSNKAVEVHSNSTIATS